MADEVGGLVDDEQVGVFVDDGEQFFQAGNLTTEGHGGTQISGKPEHQAEKSDGKELQIGADGRQIQISGSPNDRLLALR
jgi:hypothetical protein